MEAWFMTPTRGMVDNVAGEIRVCLSELSQTFATSRSWKKTWSSDHQQLPKSKNQLFIDCRSKLHLANKEAPIWSTHSTDPYTPTRPGTRFLASRRDNKSSSLLHHSIKSKQFHTRHVGSSGPASRQQQMLLFGVGGSMINTSVERCPAGRVRIMSFWLWEDENRQKHWKCIEEGHIAGAAAVDPGDDAAPKTMSASDALVFCDNPWRGS